MALDDIKKVPARQVSIGCDPEFFFRGVKTGRIRGSERIIPEGGLSAGGYSSSKFITDGVQVELNPQPSRCRALLGNEIRTCFFNLDRVLCEHKKLKASFESVVKVSKRELDALSDKSKVFGCAPSKSAYGKPTEITVNAAEYPFRSAGGHVHLGCGKADCFAPELVVPMLDTIVGNTCVLLDRDPMMAERRKLYGKAGEYREPKHGIEYRTLSNFWLRSYPLASFVWGMCRTCVNAARAGAIYQNRLLELVNIDDIRKAIDTNDFDLALKNFNKIAPFLKKIMGKGALNDYTHLSEPYIPVFRYFADKGMNHWFNQDVIEHWKKLPDGHKCGWENFMVNNVLPEFNKLKPEKQREYMEGK